MSSEKVRFGIVGVGNMGSAHIRFLSRLPNAQAVAACDINPEAFKRIPEEQRPTIRCYTALDEFLKNEAIECVIVAVPHYSHPECAVRALRAGKHVIVEKPLAVHKAAGLALLAEAARYPDRVKALMLNQRTLPAHIKIKQLIDSGELGHILRINWTITDWFRTQHYYDSGDWRASWRGEGGGVLLNQCPHQLDLMQWFFGMPARVRAAVKLGKYHDIEVEDEVNAYLEYADGKTGNFIASTGEMPGTNRLEIMAERGRLVYESGKLEFLRNEVETSVFCKTSKLSFAKAPHWTCNIDLPPLGPDFNQHGNILANVADAIRHGTPLISPLEEGIKGLELGNAMLYSGLHDCTVELPLDAEAYAEGLEKLAVSSRYQKKTVSAGDSGDFSRSF